ncbi:MAG: gluconate 2-dehydrogenase subunit 3 family protein [Bryobacteraceae bacterium]|nr:gluconate 2-dehydrogenase subunit 3 family protein [Bryobacteraceae bacterium]
MSSRRHIIKTLAGATGLVAGVAAQQPHQHADAPASQDGDKPLIAIKAPLQPGFFNKEEFETITALVDLIIPRTETPGAKDVGVQHLVDERVPKDSARQKVWRDGLTRLDKVSREQHGARFAALGPDQQVSMLTAISGQTGTPGRAFFELIKGATVDGYYETRTGLVTELGWHGNSFLREFPGCTHPEHQG